MQPNAFIAVLCVSSPWWQQPSARNQQNHWGWWFQNIFFYRLNCTNPPPGLTGASSRAFWIAWPNIWRNVTWQPGELVMLESWNILGRIFGSFHGWRWKRPIQMLLYTKRGATSSKFGWVGRSGVSWRREIWLFPSTDLFWSVALGIPGRLKMIEGIKSVVLFFLQVNIFRFGSLL